MNDIRGTFACPICGVDVPHPHSEEEQKAYHEEQLRDSSDGWIRSVLRKPEKRGWYLCRGVQVPPDQYGKPKDFWDHHERWSQLSWFNWVREGGNRGSTETEIQEVLYFDPILGGWRLRNLLGDAVRSGEESRRSVLAIPKYWRDLPVFNTAPTRITAQAGVTDAASESQKRIAGHPTYEMEVGHERPDKS